ncbi:HD domain-containing phosphohydrolase [Exiguobacterium sp. s154]
MQKAYPIALYHHERWDGTGYNQGLKGEDIPLTVRIAIMFDQTLKAH